MMRSPVFTLVLLGLLLLSIVGNCWTTATTKKQYADPFFQQFPLHPLAEHIYDQEAEAKALGRSSHAMSSLNSLMMDAHRNEQTLSQVPVIFHSYQSEARVIVGTAKSRKVKELMRDNDKYKTIALGQTDLTPVAIWLIDHRNTSVGPYQEMTISFYVSQKELPYTLAVPFEGDDRAALLYPFFMRLTEHSRFFNWKSVVVGQRDGESTDTLKSFVESRMLGSLPTDTILQTEQPPITSNSNDTTVFQFTDDYHDSIVSGAFGVTGDKSWSSWWSTGKKIFRSLGLAAIFDLKYAKKVHFKTVSSTTEQLTDTYAMMKKCQFREFRTELGDELTFGDSSTIGRDMIDMEFQPEYVVRMQDLKQAIAAPRVSKDSEHSTVKKPLTFEKIVDNQNPQIVVEDNTSQKVKVKAK